MDWADLSLRLVRAVGAMAGAAAGIAALLTDGAFVKRPIPLSGKWRDFPFAKYRVTRWGGTLLAIILIAPMVQFVGDWMKDASDAKSTADLRQDIESTVASSTDRARGEIVSTVQTESDRQTTAAEKVASQVSDVAAGASRILKEVDRTLYPFKDVMWAYEVQINLNHPKIAPYRDFLRAKAKEIFHQQPGSGDTDPSGSVMGSTPYPNTDTFKGRGARKHLLIHIDSPLFPTLDGAYGAILGYPVIVDIFANPPTTAQLASSGFASQDYSITLDPPFNDDTYGMAKSNGQFPFENYRIFMLIYVPSDSATQQPNDALYVQYYWHAMAKFDFAAADSKTSILGLPDLAGKQFSFRLYTIPEAWGDAPPYTLTSLRMRVGAQEILFDADSMAPPETAGGFLIYRKIMPQSFDDLLQLFATVRSDEDTQPLPDHELRLSVTPRK